MQSIFLKKQVVNWELCYFAVLKQVKWKKYPITGFLIILKNEAHFWFVPVLLFYFHFAMKKYHDKGNLWNKLIQFAESESSSSWSICKRQQEYPRNGVSYLTLKVHPVCATPPPRLGFWILIRQFHQWGPNTQTHKLPQIISVKAEQDCWRWFPETVLSYQSTILCDF